MVLPIIALGIVGATAFAASGCTTDSAIDPKVDSQDIKVGYIPVTPYEPWSKSPIPSNCQVTDEFNLQEQLDHGLNFPDQKEYGPYKVVTPQLAACNNDGYLMIHGKQTISFEMRVDKNASKYFLDIKPEWSQYVANYGTLSNKSNIVFDIVFGGEQALSAEETLDSCVYTNIANFDKLTFPTDYVKISFYTYLDISIARLRIWSCY